MAEMSFTGNLRTAPVWAADFGGREHILALPGRIDPTAFTDASGIPVQVTAAASASATSITVSALTIGFNPSTILIAQGATLIPAGTVLDFGGAKFARLTADAHYGDTTLTVSALVTALSGSESTVYSKYGNEEIPSGTFVGRVFGSGTAFGAYVNGTTTENYLTLFDLPIARRSADVEFYRPGSQVKENYLPNYSTVLNPSGTPSNALVAIRALYRCFIGQD